MEEKIPPPPSSAKPGLKGSSALYALRRERFAEHETTKSKRTSRCSKEKALTSLDLAKTEETSRRRRKRESHRDGLMPSKEIMRGNVRPEKHHRRKSRHEKRHDVDSQEPDGRIEEDRDEMGHVPAKAKSERERRKKHKEKSDKAKKKKSRSKAKSELRPKNRRAKSKEVEEHTLNDDDSNTGPEPFLSEPASCAQMDTSPPEPESKSEAVGNGSLEAQDSEEAFPCTPSSAHPAKRGPKRLQDFTTAEYIDAFEDIQNSVYALCTRVSKLRELLFSSIPRKASFQCQIDRTYDSAGHVTYSLIMPIEDDFQDRRMILMVARQKTGTVKTTYILSLEASDVVKKYEERSSKYFGKLQVAKNPIRLKLGLCQTVRYILYDSGYNPKRIVSPAGEERQETASIIFSHKAAETRQATVAIRKGSEAQEDEFPLSRQHARMIKHHITGQEEEKGDASPPLNARASRAIAILSKVPLGSRKRIACSELCKFPIAPSKKNLELAPNGRIDPKLEQPSFGLGRIGNERFFLVANYPLSPMQAFAVALARFDYCKTYESNRYFA